MLQNKSEEFREKAQSWGVWRGWSAGMTLRLAVSKSRMVRLESVVVRETLEKPGARKTRVQVYCGRRGS